MGQPCAFQQAQFSIVQAALLLVLVVLVPWSLLSSITSTVEAKSPPELDQFSSARALSHLETLIFQGSATEQHAREAGTSANDYVLDTFKAHAQSIKDALEAGSSTQITIYDIFPDGFILQAAGHAKLSPPSLRSIVVTFEHAAHPAQPLVGFGAHSDTHYTGPGANDDTAWVATLMELMTNLGSAPSDAFAEHGVAVVLEGEEEMIFSGAINVKLGFSEIDRIVHYVNLESCGGFCPPSLNQVECARDAEWYRRALRGVPAERHVTGTGLTQMALNAGLVASGTTFRYYTEGEGRSGIEFVHILNSQIYHTAYDQAGMVAAGQVQTGGDVLLALAREPPVQDAGGLASMTFLNFYNKKLFLRADLLQLFPCVVGVAVLAAFFALPALNSAAATEKGIYRKALVGGLALAAKSAVASLVVVIGCVCAAFLCLGLFVILAQTSVIYRAPALLWLFVYAPSACAALSLARHSSLFFVSYVYPRPNTFLTAFTRFFYVFLGAAVVGLVVASVLALLSLAAELTLLVLAALLVGVLLATAAAFAERLGKAFVVGVIVAIVAVIFLGTVPQSMVSVVSFLAISGMVMRDRSATVLLLTPALNLGVAVALFSLPLFTRIRASLCKESTGEEAEEASENSAYVVNALAFSTSTSWSDHMEQTAAGSAEQEKESRNISCKDAWARLGFEFASFIMLLAFVICALVLPLFSGGAPAPGEDAAILTHPYTSINLMLFKDNTGTLEGGGDPVLGITTLGYDAHLRKALDGIPAEDLTVAPADRLPYAFTVANGYTLTVPGADTEFTELDGPRLPDFVTVTTEDLGALGDGCNRLRVHVDISASTAPASIDPRFVLYFYNPDAAFWLSGLQLEDAADGTAVLLESTLHFTSGVAVDNWALEEYGDGLVSVLHSSGELADFHLFFDASSCHAAEFRVFADTRYAHGAPPASYQAALERLPGSLQRYGKYFVFSPAFVRDEIPVAG